MVAAGGYAPGAAAATRGAPSGSGRCNTGNTRCAMGAGALFVRGEPSQAVAEWGAPTYCSASGAESELEIEPLSRGRLGAVERGAGPRGGELRRSGR